MRALHTVDPFAVEYAVAEIFYSIQGEGMHTGLPAVFIRMAGCNLNCHFCDTDHTQRFTLSAFTIANVLDQYPVKNVILTGGEPTLQPLKVLVDHLHELGYWVAIETNGTGVVPVPIDWVTVSPKRPTEFDATCDEMKVVYEGQDLSPYQPTIRASHTREAPLKFLQPCSMRNVAATVRAVKENYGWRLSVQVHKLIGLR